jgi:hypothetical protein
MFLREQRLSPKEGSLEWKAMDSKVPVLARRNCALLVIKDKGEYKETAKAERERRTRNSGRLSVLQPKTPSTSHLSDLESKLETAII